MKKLIGLLLAMLVVSMATVYAQRTSDSTRISASLREDQPNEESRSHYAPKDYQAVESWDIPAALRSTLQGYRYKGWKEGGRFYKSIYNRGYILNLASGNSTRNFYFDRNGNEINTRVVWTSLD
ncbi:hypothetical protein ACFQ21_29930 [Ohtaekwangia kribbensis]|jgi:hypothetical protein|uniref:Uncharacterized protein n=1 Tax=Ohtaekwangia kribbensis TaxID=688913 RepID=A0ABW3KC96_9BACT